MNIVSKQSEKIFLSEFISYSIFKNNCHAFIFIKLYSVIWFFCVVWEQRQEDAVVKFLPRIFFQNNFITTRIRDSLYIWTLYISDDYLIYPATNIVQNT